VLRRRNFHLQSAHGVLRRRVDAPCTTNRDRERNGLPGYGCLGRLSHGVLERFRIIHNRRGRRFAGLIQTVPRPLSMSQLSRFSSICQRHIATLL
jgi:hypothetical protein